MMSPSFKGNITNLMRQRQLFLNATRDTCTGTGNCGNGIFTRLWTRILGFIPCNRVLNVGTGVAIGLAISTQFPMLRCIPQTLYSSPAYTYASIVGREALDKLIAVNSLVFMGLTSTVISAVILSAFRFGPFRSRQLTSSASACSPGSGSGSGSGSESDDSFAAFDSLFYKEYDAMMLAPDAGSGSGSGSGSELTSFSAVPVTTPRCELVITYVPARSAFGYYTDRKDSIPYTHLETAARMFLVKNARPDIAKLAYVDRRRRYNTDAVIVDTATAATATAATATAATAATASAATDVAAVTSSSGHGGIFAMFKSYNRKPAPSATTNTNTTTDTAATSTAATDSATATNNTVTASDTHFVYLGTMQDYKDTCDKNKKSPTRNGSESCEETPYVNVKYAEFKSRSKL